MSEKRIWELDALRGVCILCMIAIHFVYDLVELYGIVNWDYPPLFALVKQWGGVLFLLISGVCVTLGHHPVRRGLIVFAGGLLCTAVTGGMYLLQLSDSSILIWFGVLHCLGVCMLLWPLFQKMPLWLLGVLGAVLAGLGLWFQGIKVPFDFLAPLGLVSEHFASSDYFPLLPHLGFFLLGAVLGRTAYRNRQSLLPRVDPQRQPIRFFCVCGRQSLPIYLLHQPVLALVCSLIDLF